VRSDVARPTSHENSHWITFSDVSDRAPARERLATACVAGERLPYGRG
jgi:hypothetical protein